MAALLGKELSNPAGMLDAGLGAHVDSLEVQDAGDRSIAAERNEGDFTRRSARPSRQNTGGDQRLGPSTCVGIQS